MNFWQVRGTKLSLEKPLLMGILNVTPDSFSDGGLYFTVEKALQRAEKLLEEGADILDIGGESTRPSSQRVSLNEELNRVIPVIEKISETFPEAIISIDTTRSETARQAVSAGAHIVNDISGLRFDPSLAQVAAETGCGLVLMHSRGSFEEMHCLPHVASIIPEVIEGLSRSVELAMQHKILQGQIVIDPGIGFGKSPEQNLEIIAKLREISGHFPDFPVLIGASRKSFLAKILDNSPVEMRLPASIAAAIFSILNGAKIIRVHDVKEHLQAIKFYSALGKFQ
jgi:dihydropteroate synthase